MAASPIRVAIVGCGAIALEHLAFLAPSPLVEVVGVCDASPAAADFARSKVPGARAYRDLTAMLEAERPTVVHVLTPPHTHPALAAQCAEAGCHVICEKPAAGTLGELDAMLATADGNGTWLMESQNYRYNQPVLDLVAAIGSGRVGEVREVDVMISLDLVSGRFGDLNLTGPGVNLPGGAVHDMLPHMAYLFLMLSGAETSADRDPVQVYGRLWNASGNVRVGFDQVDALVVSGAVRGRLRLASDLAPDAMRLVVRGTAGSAETDIWHPYLRVEGGANVGKRIAVEHLVSGSRLAWSAFTDLRDKVMQFGSYHGMTRMLDDTYSRLADGAAVPISRAQMRDTAALVDAIVALAGAS